MSFGHSPQDLLQQIRQSEFYTEATKESEKYISNLRCPVCSEHEAYLFKAHPFKLYCNRKNKCGEIRDTRSLFPIKIIHFETDYPPTVEDPHRPATEYLKNRGLSASLDGLQYEYWPNVRNSGSGAVMFGMEGSGGTVYNGRLLNPPENEGKTHNKGSTSGCHWQHPTLNYANAGKIYVTEGIIDALSLIEAGHPAIAILSAASAPEKFPDLAYEKLVLAFDNDEAGKKATKRWAKYIGNKTRESPEAISPLEGDWNDYLRANGSDNVKNRFKEDYDTFKYHGSLAAAQGVRIYADILASKGRIGVFPYEGSLYESSEPTDPKNPLKVICIGRFTVECEHDQLDMTNPEKPVNEFSVIVRKRGRKPARFIATAQELTSPQALKAMLLERGGVLFNGSQNSAHALVKMMLDKPRPVVRQLHITGYDHKSNCYVFRTHMITESGELVSPDKNGFFRTDASEYVRPAAHKSIQPLLDAEIKPIADLLYRAWGVNALTALSWLVASFFVNQIKAAIGFFPFLSLHGDTQTGKSTFLRILNALQCLDEEGLPMRKTNTAKGELRTIAQKSGLFTGLLEWPTELSKARFDIDNILTLFNDNPLQVRAMKTNQLELQKLAFYGSLVFAQNREPFIEKKHKERVVSLHFSEADLSSDTRNAVEELSKISLEHKASFFPYVMAHRVMIGQCWQEYYQNAVAELGAFGVSSRIQETHGIVLGFYRLVSEILNIDVDIAEFIGGLAAEKHRHATLEPETAADVFLSILLDLDGNDGVTGSFLELKGDKFFINLSDAVHYLRSLGHSVGMDQSQLSKSLLEHPELLKNNVPHRFSGHTKKAYVFSNNLVKLPAAPQENL